MTEWSGSCTPTRTADSLSTLCLRSWDDTVGWWAPCGWRRCSRRLQAARFVPKYTVGRRARLRRRRQPSIPRLYPRRAAEASRKMVEPARAGPVGCRGVTTGIRRRGGQKRRLRRDSSTPTAACLTPSAEFRPSSDGSSISTAGSQSSNAASRSDARRSALGSRATRTRSDGRAVRWKRRVARQREHELSRQRRYARCQAMATVAGGRGDVDLGSAATMRTMAFETAAGRSRTRRPAALARSRAEAELPLREVRAVDMPSPLASPSALLALVLPSRAARRGSRCRRRRWSASKVGGQGAKIRFEGADVDAAASDAAPRPR